MIKLNAGFSRKVGEVNYGSRGASVNLELELDSGAIQDSDKLHEKIRALFGLARKAVDEELQNGGGKPKPSDRPKPADDPKPADNPKPAASSNTPVCAECGTDRVSEKVVKYSSEKFGRILCYGCQRKLGNGKE